MDWYQVGELGNALRNLLTSVAIGGLAFGLLAVGGAMSAESVAMRLPAPAGVTAEPAVKIPVVETDADRRERLNARMQDMIRAGKGGRLSEPRATQTPSRPASPRRQAPRVTRPEAPAPTAVATSPSAPSSHSSPARAEFSTITPPAYTGRPVRTSGGRYQPPRLDLITPPVVPDSDVECLTQAIYYEARNESVEGQAAVAEVVINRSRARGYPQKICQVVYQRNSRTCQFTFTCDGSIGRSPVNMTAWARAERIAREVYDGRSKSLLPRTSVNYHANYVRPSWGRRLERVRQIGAHIFYGSALNGQGTPGAEPAHRQAPNGLQFVRNEAMERAYAQLQTDLATSTTAN